MDKSYAMVYWLFYDDHVGRFLMTKNLKLSFFALMAFFAHFSHSHASEALLGEGGDDANTPMSKYTFSMEAFVEKKQQALAAIKKENPTLEELEAAYGYSGNKDTFQKILAKARSIYYKGLD